MRVKPILAAEKLMGFAGARLFREEEERCASA
jgi:hypothetical protein